MIEEVRRQFREVKNAKSAPSDVPAIEDKAELSCTEPDEDGDTVLFLQITTHRELPRPTHLLLGATWSKGVRLSAPLILCIVWPERRRNITLTAILWRTRPSNIYRAMASMRCCP